MVRVVVEYERFRPVVESLLAYGIGRYIANQFVNRFGRRYAGEFSGLILTGAGIASNIITDIPYESDVKQIASAMGLAGLDDLVKVYVFDETVAWFTDANTLVVRNVGAFSSTATHWEVYVNGSKVSVSSVEGSESKVVLHLASSAPKGWVNVIVKPAIPDKPMARGFAGRLYVP